MTGLALSFLAGLLTIFSPCVLPLAPLVIAAAPGARVRLRLANVAAARFLPLAVEGAKTAIVAIDGQPSAPFAPLHDLVPIGPRARFELVFDMPDFGSPHFDVPREAGTRSVSA